MIDFGMPLGRVLLSWELEEAVEVVVDDGGGDGCEKKKKKSRSCC